MMFRSCLMTILAVAFLTNTDGQPSLGCEEEALPVRTCLEDLNKNTDYWEDLSTINKQEVDKCFNKQRCEKPVYTGYLETPVAHEVVAMLGILREKWPTFSDNVKKCVKDSILDEALATANECMARKEVAPLHKDEFRTDILRFMSNGSDAYIRLLNGIFRTTIALKKCRMDKGNAVALTVGQCLGEILETLDTRYQNDEQNCELNLTTLCRLKSDDVKDAMCSCRRDTGIDILTVIEKHQATRKDVPRAAFVEDMHNIFEDVEKRLSANISRCFDNPNDEETETFVDAASFISSILMTDPSRKARVLLGFLGPEGLRYSQNELKFFHATLSPLIEDCD